jgi:hypothetical protein
MSFKEEGYSLDKEVLPFSTEIGKKLGREFSVDTKREANGLECEYYHVCCDARTGCDAEEKSKCGLWNNWKSADFALLFKELIDDDKNYLFKF